MIKKQAYELQLGDIIIAHARKPSAIVCLAHTERSGRLGASFVEVECADGSIRRFGWFLTVEVED